MQYGLIVVKHWQSHLTDPIMENATTELDISSQKCSRHLKELHTWLSGEIMLILLVSVQS